ncbi:MAG: hypothetical protein AB7G28_21920 [Pirellulales bacterium]
MSITSDDLNAFHRFAVTTIADRGADSLQELVDLWELENADPQLHAENVAAVRAALRDMENGDKGRPAHLVIDELRAELASWKRT